MDSVHETEKKSGVGHKDTSTSCGDAEPRSSGNPGRNCLVVDQKPEKKNDVIDALKTNQNNREIKVNSLPNDGQMKKASTSRWPGKSHVKKKSHVSSCTGEDRKLDLENADSKVGNLPFNGHSKKTTATRWPGKVSNVKKKGRGEDRKLDLENADSKVGNLPVNGHSKKTTATRWPGHNSNTKKKDRQLASESANSKVNNLQVNGHSNNTFASSSPGPRGIVRKKNLLADSSQNISLVPKNSHHRPGPKMATRQLRPMRRVRMKELEAKDPTEVMLTLLNPKEGFKELIEQNLSRDELDSIISLLALACKSEQKENLKELIKSVQSVHQFAYVGLQTHLGELQNDSSTAQQLSSLGNLLLFLETTQELEPKILTTDIILPQLKEIISEKSNNGGLQELGARFNVLETKRKQFKDKYSVSFLRQAQAAELPPDDFRQIPIIPGKSDLSEKPNFLRPNIVEGSYQDTEHYLDVQFRLLREDFVRPLREGIAEYVKQMNNPLSKKLQNVRVYPNVHVQEALLSEHGILHTVYFDVRPLGKIDWQTTKRLMFGSLLCFSHDSFKTVIFGTVASREPKHHSKGLLDVKFEENKNLSVLPTATFVILESTGAYFEAYRHNLMALQSMDILPFKEFIVELSREIEPPLYLKDLNVKYCLEPVLLPVGSELKPLSYQNDIDSKHCLEPVVNDSTDKDRSGSKYANICGDLNYFEILTDSDWPTCTDMGLDPSQFNAFKLAMTKQLAIIQGPPGTGKTYVGLKIVQALLYNEEARKTLGTTGQILVICYTNHALDQFLEGVLKCTDSIVRIGGRCKSKLLEEYTLSSHKDEMKKLRYRYIDENQKSIRNRMEELLKKNHKLEQSIHEIGRSILPENDLKCVIGSHHFKSLDFNCPHWFMRKVKPLIPSWLGIKFPEEENDELLDEEEASYPEDVEPVPDPVANTNQIDFYLENMEYAENVGEGEFENDLRMGESKLHTVTTVIASRKKVSDGKSDGWRVQGGKKRKKNVSDYMESVTPMTDREINKVKNVWNLSYGDRRRLYKAWLAKLQIRRQCELEELKQEYLEALKRADELRSEKDYVIARTKCVIGMTTTGAARLRSLVIKLRPQIVIVEEAAEVLEAHIITALTESTQHLILIGDHKQLRPNPTVYDLSKRYNLDVSLFERLVNNGLPFCRLGIQHRMKPCISTLLVPHIYESLEDHESVKEYEDIRGIEKSMFFINHDFKEVTEHDSMSRKNHHEAQFLVRLCGYLLLQGYDKGQITILATYSGQSLLLKRIVEGSDCKDVRVAVVDNYQGEENDIILLSLVRSNEEGNVGFLKVHNRVCVALSRAKKGLYCIGNFDLLRSESQLWENVYEELLLLEAVGPSLKVSCKNHGKTQDMKEPDDFDNTIDGGCSEPCDFRLHCGHACELRCHPVDAEHVKYKCLKVCPKVRCDLQHKCPNLCHQECEDCVVPVMKVIPTCGHEQELPCHLDAAKSKCHVPVVKIIPKCGHDVQVPCHLDVAKAECKLPCQKIRDCGHECRLLCFEPCGACHVAVTIKGLCGHHIRVQCSETSDENAVQKRCTEKCERKLSCGHSCPDVCGRDCPRLCEVIVEHDSPCGHHLRFPCHMKRTARCYHPCGKRLECGHLCAGNCTSCHQGKFHVPCKKMCGRSLICGHVCNFTCWKNCPPCRKPCQQHCPHEQCQHPCCFPCYPCRMPCTWRCQHMRCTRECCEPCNRPPCTRPCPIILKCQHECIGFCGEPCPSKCRVCDRQEVTQIFFGQEGDSQARFIQLEDCSDIFEVRGLEQFITEQKSSQIKLLSCPKCNTPIRHNVHFSYLVKKSISKVEKTKTTRFELQTRMMQKRFNMQSSLVKEHPKLFPLHGKTQSHQETVSTSICSEIVFLVMEQLRNRKCPSDVIAQTENLMLFARNMKSVEETLSDIKFSIGQEKFSTHISSSLTSVARAITANRFVVSSQLISDICWEIHRLVLLTTLLKESENQDQELRVRFDSAIETLMKMEPFREEQMKILDDMKFSTGVLSNSIMFNVMKGTIRKPLYLMSNSFVMFNAMKDAIRKPLNLRQGRWYNCRNGHVFFVDGGNEVSSYCNECKPLN